MRRSSAVMLTFLAAMGCATRHPPIGELAVSPALRPVVRVEVTNTFGRSVDVYYGSQFLGTLAAEAYGSYSIPPTTARRPIYARWSGRPDQMFDILERADGPVHPRRTGASGPVTAMMPLATSGACLLPPEASREHATV